MRRCRHLPCGQNGSRRHWRRRTPTIYPSGHPPQGVGGEIIPSLPLHHTEGRSRSGDARSRANRNPLAAPAAGAAVKHAPPPEQPDRVDAPNKVADPQTHPPRHHAILASGSQRRGHGSATTGIVRSQTTLWSTSSSMPSTASEAMAQAQLLLRFPPAAD